DLQRKHGLPRSRPAGRARDRHPLRRRALRRFADRGRWAGAHLSRPAAGNGRNHRQGTVRVNELAQPTVSAATGPEGSGLRVETIMVTYRNGFTALRNASFSLPTGTITALVGVNGSGKSTLFKAIMGFVPVSGGSVSI